MAELNEKDKDDRREEKDDVTGHSAYATGDPDFEGRAARNEASGRASKGEDPDDVKGHSAASFEPNMEPSMEPSQRRTKGEGSDDDDVEGHSLSS